MAAHLKPLCESFLASFSAPCLVRPKIRKEPCFRGQHHFQQAEFAILIDFVEVQVDLFGGLGDGTEFDANGVADVGLHQFLDRGLDGGGEEHGLPLGGDHRHDALDGGQEAHVQHAVGFVEHQDFDFAEGDQLAIQEIAEAAGSGHHDGGAVADLLELDALVHAADGDRGMNAGAARDLADDFGDLQGEFAGGRENDAADARLGALIEQ